MNDIKTTVAKNLLFYRKQKKLSQKALAEKVGVKHNTISSWESCTNAIDIDSLFKICDALNVSINRMLDVEDSIKSFVLTSSEKQLILSYRDLSEQGQEYILQTMDLVKDKY